MANPSGPLPAFATFTMLCLGLFGQHASAQTLPQSTIDRQQIMQLQNDLNNPAITPSQRRDIEMQISTLEYRINTRPLIIPPPNLAAPASSTPVPYLAKSADAVLVAPQGATPALQDACSERAVLIAQLAATERNAPLGVLRAYAREVLQRLAAVPC